MTSTDDKNLENEWRPSMMSVVEVGRRDRDVAPQWGMLPIKRLFSGESYRWITPSSLQAMEPSFVRAMEGFHAADGEQHCPPVELVRIDRAVIAGSLVYDIHDRERPILIEETYRECDRPAVIAPRRSDVAEAIHLLVAGQVDRLFLGSAGSFNYGHWLIDDLPRAVAVDQWHHGSERPLAVLMPSHGVKMDTVRADAIRRCLAPGTSIHFLPPNRSHRVDKLLYCSPTSYHPVQKSPAAIHLMTLATIGGFARSGNGAGRRLFVHRELDTTRQMINRDVVRQCLLPLGFTDYTPSHHDFDGQVKTFADAEMVVGVMGAGMTNTVFCAAGTSIIHLAPEGWIEPFYLDLATVKKHDYHVVYGSAEDTSRAPHLRDFSIDPNALRTACETAMRQH